jgi:hypothetical protein
MGAVTHDNVDDVFTHHPPKGDFQIEKYHRLRQAGKVCAKAVLDNASAEVREEALDTLAAVILAETGPCRDQGEAIGMLEAGKAFAGGIGQALATAKGNDPGDLLTIETETTQAVISCVRGALMWANASVALEGRI